MIYIAIGLSTIIVCLFIVHYKTIDRMQQTIDTLTDKLMSKDFKEYKELTQEPNIYEPVAVTEQEEWAREIEDMKV